MSKEIKDTIIKTDQLCKHFGSNDMSITILDHVNLEIYKGDFTVIMGPSGAGKSSLMYALSGMDKPSEGKIFFNNVDISKYSNNKLALFRRKHCGFVFQQIFLLDYMSIMDNILTAGFLKYTNRKELIENAKNLLNQVNINEGILRKFPNQISGGEAQRCAIIRAIINNPEVIFADEPTGALNSSNSESVLNVLNDINNNKQSIIMVTHDIKSALRGNRILFFRDGNIYGECNLGAYTKDSQDRELKLRTFLNEMNW